MSWVAPGFFLGVPLGAPVLSLSLLNLVFALLSHVIYGLCIGFLHFFLSPPLLPIASLLFLSPQPHFYCPSLSPPIKGAFVAIRDLCTTQKRAVMHLLQRAWNATRVVWKHQCVLPTQLLICVRVTLLTEYHYLMYPLGAGIVESDWRYYNDLASSVPTSLWTNVLPFSFS